MTFSESISTVFSKYTDGKGRASRSEYWWWNLFVFLLTFVVAIIEMAIGLEDVLTGILSLGLLLPNVCVSIRRCHDSGHSGWWVICPIVNIIMMFLPSDPNTNEYGEPEAPSTERETY